MSPRRLVPADLLVVDDEPGIRQALRQMLEYEGYRVRTAESGPRALELYRERPADLVLLDIKMAPMDGLEVLDKLRVEDPDATVVVISGHGSVETAVEALKRGAFDFLEKPPDREVVLRRISNALAERDLERENEALRGALGPPRASIIGESALLKEALEKVALVAPTRAYVLITGENGTGKELVAREIHALSDRARGPFVEVNCAAIPHELIESELFGHEKGAFTGAHARRKGKFELADGGTLFLDEVGDMSLAAQAKVLRALQEGVIQRVGGDHQIAVDVRVLAATNKDIEQEIAAGNFREDLYYRLNVVPLHVPSLDERREDIPLLVRHFAELYCAENGLPPKTFEDEAIAMLQARPWPGNVRELRNTVERLVILAPAGSVRGEEVEGLTGPPVGGRERDVRTEALLDRNLTFSDYRDAAEKAFLERKLLENDWNVSETARQLDMQRSHLYKKIEKYGLSREATARSG
ncbi:MAG TPA: sigma-54 dependent transcriptional regulator [Gemmatimonadota bacterium]|nr:sigma-54 dependent transcriptional regulator [Gemmatimonadota bacterium]